MSPVTYRTEGCGVRFDWEDNPEAVEYQIQIDGKDLEECNGGTTCLVPAERLPKSLGNKVTISAKNRFGWGDHSEPQTDELMVIHVSDVFSDLRFEEQTPTSVSLTWDPFEKEQETQHIIEKFEPPNIWLAIGPIPEENNFTVSNLYPGQSYSFRVHSTNPCGSSYSNSANVTLEDKPSVMNPVIST